MTRRPSLSDNYNEGKDERVSEVEQAFPTRPMRWVSSEEAQNGQGSGIHGQSPEATTRGSPVADFDDA